MDTVRIDLWLWAARFFKSRALAKKACDLGRVDSNGHPAKAAREVKVGDMLRVTNDSGEFTVEVLSQSDTRGPAPVARALYRETEESRALRQKAAEQRKAERIFQPMPPRRPSKRDRRRIIQFRSGK